MLLGANGTVFITNKGTMLIPDTPHAENRAASQDASAGDGAKMIESAPIQPSDSAPRAEGPVASPLSEVTMPQSEEALVLAKELRESLSQATIINDVEKELVIQALEKGQLSLITVVGAKQLSVRLSVEGMIGSAALILPQDANALMLHKARSLNLVPVATFELARMGKIAIAEGFAAMAVLAATPQDVSIREGNRTLAKLSPRVQSDMAAAIANVEAMFQEYQYGITSEVFACCICFLKENGTDTDVLSELIADKAEMVSSHRKFMQNICRALLDEVRDSTLTQALAFFPGLDEQLTELRKPTLRRRTDPIE